MEKTAIERKYELVVILNAKLSDEEKDEIIKSVIELVKKENGNVINSQVWLEKQKLSFEIKKCTEGTYYIINLTITASSISRLRSLLKLNEKILRFEFIKVDSVKKKEATKA
jgi:small subunit ribosomal protein S6